MSTRRPDDPCDQPAPSRVIGARSGDPHSASIVDAPATLPHPAHRMFVALSIALTAPMIGLFYWPAAHGLDITGHPIGRDFINVWAGAQLAFGGSLSVLFDQAGYHAAIGELFGRPLRFHIWSYPPNILPLLWPFAHMTYWVALAAWTFGLFALFASVTLSQILPGQRVRALVVLALAPACLINTIGGQNGFLTAALFLGGILCVDRRPLLAGVLFGLLTFKPQLGFVLPFALVALGAWRTIAMAAVTALALFGLSLALFGLEPWQRYLAETGAVQLVMLERFEGFFTYMMVSVLAGLRFLGLSQTAAMGVQVAIAIPVLATACWAVRATSDPADRAFVLASAAPLLTPYALNYDLTALAAVMVWRLFGPYPRDRVRTAILCLAWIIPILGMYLSLVRIGIAPLALVAVFALAAYDAIHRPATGNAAVT